MRHRRRGLFVGHLDGRGPVTDGNRSGLQDPCGRRASGFLSNRRQRLETYFKRNGEGYTIASFIRRRVVFAPHNVLQDPPFTDIDLVACRNLLIYFNLAAQQKALTLFHFGLKKDGILFLGPSESVGSLSSEFPAISEHHKVYYKQREARLPADISLPISLEPGALEAALTCVNG